jgi:hypothetical protein
MDQELAELVKSGIVSQDEALGKCFYPEFFCELLKTEIKSTKESIKT